MKRNRSTDILPRKFEPPGNVKLKLPITGARKYDHITYMPELTWLPVRDQLFFKDMAPDYTFVPNYLLVFQHSSLRHVQDSAA
jgi:hypothetical protein